MQTSRGVLVSSALGRKRRNRRHYSGDARLIDPHSRRLHEMKEGLPIDKQ